MMITETFVPQKVDHVVSSGRLALLDPVDDRTALITYLFCWFRPIAQAPSWPVMALGSALDRPSDSSGVLQSTSFNLPSHQPQSVT
jgi:hypothetical protein